MSTNSPNIFAAPASQPQPNVMNNFSQRSNEVLPMLTPGQQAIMQYRNSGGAPMGRGVVQSANVAQPVNQLANVQGGPQSTGMASFNGNPPMGAPAFGSVNSLMGQPTALAGGTNAGGVMPGAIRPPRNLGRMQARY